MGIGYRVVSRDTLILCDRLYTSCVPDDDNPCPFYERTGFVYTGEEDDGELVMRLAL